MYGYKCFAENRDIFRNTKTQPEKFNLYNGLAGVSEGVVRILNEIDDLRQEVPQLRIQLAKATGIR